MTSSAGVTSRMTPSCTMPRRSALKRQRRIGALLRTAARWRRGGKTAVPRLDEHVGRPRTDRGTVARVVIERGPRSSHLIERHPLFHHVLHAVTDDRDHV